MSFRHLYISEEKTGTEAIILPLQLIRFGQYQRSSKFSLMMTEVCIVWDVVVIMFLIFSCNYGNESLKNNEIHGYDEQIHRCLIPKLYIFFLTTTLMMIMMMKKKRKKKYMEGTCQKLVDGCIFLQFCSVTKLIKKKYKQEKLDNYSSIFPSHESCITFLIIFWRKKK